MQTVVDVATMRRSDAATIEGGVSGKELMRRAGEGIFQSYRWRGRVGIVCGSGNNAGDGYVLAICLQRAKIPCTLILLSDAFSSDGAYYFEQCRVLGVETVRYSDDFSFDAYTEIVDCIFGTGFRKEVKGTVARVIEKINASGKTVICADINSGLDGDSGLSSLCVRSDLTVSIGFYKSGHFLGQAKDVIGSLCNLDIGIGLHGNACTLFEKEDAAALFPKRRQDSHKGDYGYVSILGGCREYAGAVKLANLSCAALRSGCGVAQLIVPDTIAESIAPYLLESTLAPLPTGADTASMLEALDHALAKQKALAVGMGWGRDDRNGVILKHILETYALPLVIDADGLNTLAEMDAELLRRTRCRVILTPHLKEFERLSGMPIAAVRKDPIAAAKKYAKETRVCLLLKGACSIVTDGEECYLVDRGCVGMATAGSGDVLSGVLAGLLGFSEPTPRTVACGAYLAGRAGELAQEKINPVSMLASDTVSQIGAAISELIS